MPFLVIVLGGTVSALVWGIINPGKTISTPQLASFTFPENVSLTGWQQLNSVGSHSDAQEKIVSKTFIADKTYQYRRNNLLLHVEVHYMQVSKGDVNHLIGRYTSIPPLSEIYQQEEVGAYALLVDQQRLYLTSCINPQGKGTATNRQYFVNKMLAEVDPERIVAWLVGRDALFDQRCLWTIMSMPMEKPSTKEKTHLLLKEAWESWFTWWQSRFPQPY
jgi:cyanosortase A-associated protein